MMCNYKTDSSISFGNFISGDIDSTPLAKEPSTAKLSNCALAIELLAIRNNMITLVLEFI